MNRAQRSGSLFGSPSDGALWKRGSATPLTWTFLVELTGKYLSVGRGSER
jgi:hypothetical protein